MPGDIPRLTHLVFRRRALRARPRIFKFMQNGDGSLPSHGAVLTHIGVADSDEHLRLLAHLGDAAAGQDADALVSLLAWYAAEQPYRIRSALRRHLAGDDLPPLTVRSDAERLLRGDISRSTLSIRNPGAAGGGGDGALGSPPLGGLSSPAATVVPAGSPVPPGTVVLDGAAVLLSTPEPAAWSGDDAAADAAASGGDGGEFLSPLQRPGTAPSLTAPPARPVLPAGGADSGSILPAIVSHSAFDPADFEGIIRNAVAEASRAAVHQLTAQHDAAIAAEARKREDSEIAAAYEWVDLKNQLWQVQEAARRDRAAAKQAAADAKDARAAAADAIARLDAADVSFAERVQETLLNPDIRVPRGATAAEIEALREFDLEPDMVAALQDAQLIPADGLQLNGHHHEKFLLPSEDADRLLLRIPAARDVPHSAEVDQPLYRALKGRDKEVYDNARAVQKQLRGVYQKYLFLGTLALDPSIADADRLTGMLKTLRVLVERLLHDYALAERSRLEAVSHIAQPNKDFKFTDSTVRRVSPAPIEFVMCTNFDFTLPVPTKFTAFTSR